MELKTIKEGKEKEIKKTVRKTGHTDNPAKGAMLRLLSRQRTKMAIKEQIKVTVECKGEMFVKDDVDGRTARMIEKV